jgi:hypothetical protein
MLGSSGHHPYFYFNPGKNYFGTASTCKPRPKGGGRFTGRRWAPQVQHYWPQSRTRASIYVSRNSKIILQHSSSNSWRVKRTDYFSLFSFMLNMYISLDLRCHAVTVSLHMPVRPIFTNICITDCSSMGQVLS